MYQGSAMNWSRQTRHFPLRRAAEFAGSGNFAPRHIFDRKCVDIYGKWIAIYPAQDILQRPVTHHDNAPRRIRRIRLAYTDSAWRSRRHALFPRPLSPVRRTLLDGLVKGQHRRAGARTRQSRCTTIRLACRNQSCRTLAQPDCCAQTI